MPRSSAISLSVIRRSCLKISLTLMLSSMSSRACLTRSYGPSLTFRTRKINCRVQKKLPSPQERLTLVSITGKQENENDVKFY